MENEFNLISSYNKAFILGEVGIAPVSVIKGTIDHYKQVGISGVLLWSLRGHSRLGGFYTHEEHSGYFSYHYPGFAESVGFGKDERDIMQMMINANRDTRNITRPAPPELLAPRNTTDAFQLRWKGSAGATHYSIEVTSPRIEVLFSSVTDNKPSGQTLLELPKELLRTKGLTSCSLRVNAHGEWGTLSSPSSSFTV
jgi:hypothetical protein